MATSLSEEELLFEMSEATAPKCTEGLERKGEYYEGIVADVERYLHLHATATITTYGTRTSWKVGTLPLYPSNSQETPETVADKVKVRTI